MNTKFALDDLLQLRMQEFSRLGGSSSPVARARVGRHRSSFPSVPSRSHPPPTTAEAFVVMTVGGISNRINQLMARRGEDQRLQARRVGAIMRGLGISTKSLGNLERGIQLTLDAREKIHRLAQRLGFTRKDLLNLFGSEQEFGGARCRACEKLGLTAGLKFVEPAKPTSVRQIRSQRPMPPNSEGPNSIDTI